MANAGGAKFDLSKPQLILEGFPEVVGPAPKITIKATNASTTFTFAENGELKIHNCPG